MLTFEALRTLTILSEFFPRMYVKVFGKQFSPFCIVFTMLSI
jgi:hypothetical protein